VLRRRYFFRWLRFNLLKESIQEREKTRELLKSKVVLLLPDYVPFREN
jgi:hypothetical protein